MKDNTVLDILFVEDSGDVTEPVSYEEVLKYANIDDIAGDRTTIESYITAARIQCETLLAISLIPRQIIATVRNSLRDIYLPYGPIIEVSDVKNEKGDSVDFEVRGVQWKQLHKPCKDYLEVTYYAGYPNGIPEVFKVGIAQQTSYLYEHRGDEQAGKFSPLAFGTLNPYTRT